METLNSKLSLNEYAAMIHRTSVEHGWWPERQVIEGGVIELIRRPTARRNFGEMIALMHSELSEALEEYRNGVTTQPSCINNGKPEGWAVELVDTMIRILDLLGSETINIDELMKQKMAYNERRPYRHGGKLA